MLVGVGVFVGVGVSVGVPVPVGVWVAVSGGPVDVGVWVSGTKGVFVGATGGTPPAALDMPSLIIVARPHRWIQPRGIITRYMGSNISTL